MTEMPDYEQLALDHLQDSPRTALVYALLNLAAVDRRAAEQQQEPEEQEPEEQEPEEQQPIDGGPARYATERLSVVGRTRTESDGLRWAGLKIIDRDTGETRILETMDEIDATYRMLRQALRLGGETSVRLLCEENNPDGGSIDVAHHELSRLMTAMRAVAGVRLGE